MVHSITFSAVTMTVNRYSLFSSYNALMAIRDEMMLDTNRPHVMYLTF